MKQQIKNFTFYAPTKMFFGAGEHKKVGEIISTYGFKNVLLHYGQSSIKKNGLYDTVCASLRAANISITELGGVEPNPKLGLAKQGIKICKENNIDLVLAVGGGSVIDSGKLIAVGATDDDSVDPWDYLAKKRPVQAALPVGTVLTLSASGSEMSGSAVITNEETWLKRGFGSDYHRPLFSICDPTLTYTVDKFQTGCGIVDIMMHTMERYFTDSAPFDITDRIAESLLVAVKDAGAVAIADPENYEARATLMWSGSLSHNDLTHCGREFSLPCHQLEHELSGMFDFVAHGAGLAVLFPAWARYAYTYDLDRFVQYANRVWDIDTGDSEKTALAGIAATEDYFRSIGMPVRISELKDDVPFVPTEENIVEMAEKCTFWGERILPGHKPLGKQEMIDIFRLAL